MDFTIADRLVELRRAQGYSQESLAAALGLTRQAVSRWERGESLPDTENLIALADLYGVTLDELVRPQPQELAEEDETLAEAPEEPEVPEASEVSDAESSVDVEPAEEVPEASVEAQMAVGKLPEEPLVEHTDAPAFLPIETPAANEALLAESTIPQAAVPPEAGMTAPEPESDARRTGSFLAKVLVAVVCVAVVLGILSAGFGSLIVLFGVRSTHRDEAAVELSDGKPASSTEVRYDPKKVHDLRIDWAAGPVVIRKVSDDKADSVIVTEEYLDPELSSFPMQESLSHGELSISYGKAKNRGWSGFGGQGKRLTVLIPEGMQDLGSVHFTISSYSIEARDLSCDSLQLKLASGDAELTNLTANKLELVVASGDIEATGDFSDKVDIQVGSGDVKLASSSVPASSSLQVASGDVRYLLPRDASFVVRSQVSSGDFDLGFRSKREGETDIVGKGGNSIDVNLTSGDVRIDPGR